MKTFLFFRKGAILLLAFFLTSMSLRAQDFTGAGTQSSPYLIYTAEDLLQLAMYVNAGNIVYSTKYYRLEADIDLIDYGSNFNSGKGWIPIGHSDHKSFYGYFNGNNHIIYNLYINNSSTEYDNTGLFGWVVTGSVKNLGLLDADITGNDNVGGIAGCVLDSELSNCYVIGTVSGENQVGGITGWALQSTVSNCYVTGAIDGRDNVGGVVGWNYGFEGKGIVRHCAALNPSVKATYRMNYLGRVVGYNSGDGIISDNIAFSEMSIMLDITPKTIFDENEKDGTSTTALDLQTSTGFPLGFRTSPTPWVFRPGRLPGLTNEIEKLLLMPDHLMAVAVNLSILRDNSPWSGDGKVFTLKFESNETKTVPMIISGNTASIVMNQPEQRGNWKLYDGEDYIDKVFNILDVPVNETINYISIVFSSVHAGEANNSSISATYGGTPINSGTSVLGGKTLVITAEGSGNANEFYKYTWSGTGIDTSIGNPITVYLLSNAVNVICTVTGVVMHTVSFSVVDVPGAGRNGTILAEVDGKTIIPPSKIEHNSIVEFTAKPNKYYRVKEWRNGGSLVANNTTDEYQLPPLTADATVTVEFEPITYEITFSVTGIGGTLTATVVDGEVTNNTSGKVEVMESVTITATADENYRVKGWKIDEGELTGSNTGKYELKEVTAATKITAEFELIPSKVMFSGPITAIIENTTTVVNSGNEVPHGTSVVFTANPANNYQVLHWTDNGDEVTENGTNPTYTIPITEDKTIAVTFEAIMHTVTFNHTGNGKITATVDGTTYTSPEQIQVQQGKTVSFTATPDDNHRLTGWTGATTENGTNATYLVSAAGTVSVTFAPIMHSVRFNNPVNGTLTVTANGVTVTSSPALIEQGSKLVFTATSDPGFSVKRWTNYGVKVNGTGTEYTIDNLIEAYNINVEFEDENLASYRVTFSVPGGGGILTATVDGESITSDDMVKRGSDIVFIASPTSGYIVSQWTVDASEVSGDTPNNYTLEDISDETEVIVTFVVGSPTTYAVVFGVEGNNGSLAAVANNRGIASIASEEEGSIIEFTATPITDYRVKEWIHNGGTPFGKNENTFTPPALNSTMFVSVSFEPDNYLVTYNANAAAHGTLSAWVDGGKLNENGWPVLNGKEINFIATPDPGYCVKSWNGIPVTGDNNPDFYNMTVQSADAKVTVEFGPITYKVAYSHNTGGVLNATINTNPVANNETVSYFDQIVFKANPSEYFSIKHWWLNGEIIPDEEIISSSFTLTGQTADATVTVEFEPVLLKVVFDVASGSGSIEAKENGTTPIFSPANVQEGNFIEFTANPATGYHTKDWTVNTNNTGKKDDSYMLEKLSLPTTVMVEFGINTYVVEYSSTGNGKFEASVDNGAVLPHNYRNIVFTATPEEGYQVKWIINKNVVNGNNFDYRIPLLTEDHTISVEFEPITHLVRHEVISGYGSIEAVVVGGGKITTPIAMVHDGSSIVFTAEPMIGYRVRQWTDNGIDKGAATDYTITIFEEHHVTVEFERIICVVEFSMVDNNGILSATVNNIKISSFADVPAGMSITFTAIPNAGYEVEEWKLDDEIQESKDNSFSITPLTEKITVTVSFKLIAPVITTTSLPNGTVGLSYNQILSVMSVSVVKWSIINNGSLPEGMNLNGSGMIWGIPVEAGTFTFTVQAENSLGGSHTKSLTCIIEKGVGAQVNAPALDSKTTSNITVNALTASNGQLVQYAISQSANASPGSLTWQDGLSFGGLTSNTTYYVYARTMENNNYFTGAVSVSSAITTDTITGNGEDLQANPLKANVQAGKLHLRGLTEGKQWSVYNVSGMLVHQDVATSDEADIALSAQGVYIIRSEEKTVRISYYGQ